jgi:hypothetical protein
MIYSQSWAAARGQSQGLRIDFTSPYDVPVPGNLDLLCFSKFLVRVASSARRKNGALRIMCSVYFWPRNAGRGAVVADGVYAVALSVCATPCGATQAGVGHIGLLMLLSRVLACECVLCGVFPSLTRHSRGHALARHFLVMGFISVGALFRPPRWRAP